MRAWRECGVLLATLLAACQPAAVREVAPPRACDLAGFGEAPGLTLPANEAAARKRASRRGRGEAAQNEKSQPMRYAHAIPLGHGVRNVGRWADAAPGWKAWRLWLRSEEARSVAVHLEPLALPPGAELWLCSPDGTTRQGPYRERGPNQAGKLWSPAVPGAELWLEVLAPAESADAVELTLVSAFAAFR